MGIAWKTCFNQIRGQQIGEKYFYQVCGQHTKAILLTHAYFTWATLMKFFLASVWATQGGNFQQVCKQHIRALSSPFLFLGFFGFLHENRGGPETFRLPRNQSRITRSHLNTARLANSRLYVERILPSLTKTLTQLC